jgi:hypothetical protein
MNAVTKKWVRTIFQKDSLDDCSVEELQMTAAKYPYFTPAQILYAEKLKTTDQERYDEQLQKLSLQFSNPLWLDYLLNGYGTEETWKFGEEQSADRPSDYPNADHVNKEADNIQMIEQPNEENAPEQFNISAEEHTNDEYVIEQANSRKGLYAGSPDTESSPGTEQSNEQGVQGFEQPVAHENLSLPESKTEEQTVSEEQNNTLAFEPYHTVDYFASQGIKFVQEEKPVDRFGKQLKSFTEWLKTMKRLPQGEIAKNHDESSEKEVQQLADHSVTDGDVVTEVMAEVWAKQGNREKAIAIYEKLSLLDPPKSHYFAAKIEQLKNS